MLTSERAREIQKLAYGGDPEKRRQNALRAVATRADIWKQADIDAVRKMVVENDWTAAKIATALGRTRSSVIGIIFRHKMRPDRKRTGPSMTLEQRRAAKNARSRATRELARMAEGKALPSQGTIRTKARQATMIDRVARSPEENRERAKQRLANWNQRPAALLYDQEAPGTQIQDLKWNECKWPIGDPKEASFRLCGHQRGATKAPYCRHHFLRSRDRSVDV